jgi:cell division protease FtsH
MQDAVFQKPYSEETARMIDAGVRKLVSEAYDRAKAVLTANRTSLERISEMLLKKEVVYREDIEPVLGPRTVAEQEVMVRSD